VLDDIDNAPISERVRAILGFIEKAALEPAALTPEDVRALLTEGISRAAVRDALYVVYLFSTYDRLADAFGWHVPSKPAFEAAARMLLKRGYI
jgi:alkylhydroperoxidase family enzyme